MKLRASDVGQRFEYRPIRLTGQEQKVLLVELISVRPGDARVRILETGDVVSVFPASLSVPETFDPGPVKKSSKSPTKR